MLLDDEYLEEWRGPTRPRAEGLPPRGRIEWRSNRKEALEVGDAEAEVTFG